MTRIAHVILFAAGYLFFAALLALFSFPLLPKTAFGWVMFILFAPPIYLVGEWISDRISRSWAGSSTLGKILKGTLFAIGVLVFLIVGAALSGT